MSDVHALAQAAARPPSLLPLLVVAAVGLVLLLALAFGSRLFDGTRRLNARLWCPVHGQRMRVGLQVAAWDGRAVDVTTCAAFGPDAVGCEKRCLAGGGARHQAVGAR
jgi:hypothetical protein